MLVLITYRTTRAINYKILKLYQKKASLQILGSISESDDKIVWVEQNSQLELISKTILEESPEVKLGNPAVLTRLAIHPNLSLYNFAIVAHKIHHGSDEYEGISLLSHQTVLKLRNLSPLAPEQDADLDLTEVLMNYYPKAKHYACFETGFHQTIELCDRMLLPDWLYLKNGVKSYGSNGLAFSALTAKLTTLAEKKQAKGKWIFAYLSENESTLCAVKNGKSVYCTSSSLHHELPSGRHSGKVDPALAKFIARHNGIELLTAYNDLAATNLFSANNNELSNLDTLLNSQSPAAKLTREYYINSLSESFLRLATNMQGIDGIIFTGTAGSMNPKLRQLICSKLSWLGLELSNKANLDNACKLSKKSSKVLIFSLAADPCAAMLNHLYERI